MPPASECRVFYDEADAEVYLLARQVASPERDLQLVLFEAKAKAMPMDLYGVYRIEELMV